MRAVDLIEHKRDGYELNTEEINFLIGGYCSGDIPDYQMSAFTMAVLWRGLTATETAALTRAMIASGETIDLTSITRPTVDKHSTGGVGDKTTLVVAPLVASFGIAVPKLSGRGLGHTGGTLDKLEAIPGFRVGLTMDEFFDVVNRVGVAVASATANIVPADQKLYALRDATATVTSMPLIASSIMSKKLAVDSGGIVLDVKVGEGGFFATKDAAMEFANTAVALGAQFNRPVRAVLTSMDRPLGRAIGNALEVLEAAATLQGNGPEDLVEVCVALATQMLIVSGVESDLEVAETRVRDQLESGAAWPKFLEWIAAQGGDVSCFENDDLMPTATRQITVAAPRGGTVTKIHAQSLGRLAMQLGAGRARKEDSVDHAAGIVLCVSPGSHVAMGDALAVLHTNLSGDEQAWATLLCDAVEFSQNGVGEIGSPVLDVIGTGFPTPAVRS